MFSRDSKRVGLEENGQYSFGDIAVLYRLNAQSQALKVAFDRSGIPYHIAGKKSGQDLLEDIYWQNTDELGDFQVEKVNLMTLHAAKGLEFPVVFIVGCEEHLLPLGLCGLSGDPQEERRLFYVGMTRAKERLYLVRAKRRFLFGQMYQNAPTAFLSDIEEELKAYTQSEIKTLHSSAKKQDQQMSLFDS